MLKKDKKGFTLIELLIVIAVMGILTTVVFVALNPMARFQESRNTRRWTDVNTFLSALKLHQVDNGGTYLTALDSMIEGSYYQIGTGSGCNDACPGLPVGVSLETDCINLSDLNEKGYVPKMPFDPNLAGAGVAKSGYYIRKEGNGSITVGACNPEKGTADTEPKIEVTR